MPKRKAQSSEWIDPDDPPELTPEVAKKGEYFRGTEFLGQPGRVGRRRSENRKEQISVRLDPEVLVKLREAGPGWQSQINPILRAALGLDQPVAKKRRAA